MLSKIHLINLYSTFLYRKLIFNINHDHILKITHYNVIAGIFFDWRDFYTPHVLLLWHGGWIDKKFQILYTYIRSKGSDIKIIQVGHPYLIFITVFALWTVLVVLHGKWIERTMVNNQYCLFVHILKVFIYKLFFLSKVPKNGSRMSKQKKNS